MIKRLLRSIRQKPKNTRDTIALAIAGSVTAVVLLAWVYNVPTKYATIEEKHAESEAAAPGFSQFFDEIGDQITEVKASIKESIATSTKKDETVVVEEKTPAGNDVPDRSWASSSVEITPPPPAEEAANGRVVRIVTKQPATTSTSTNSVAP